MTLKKTENEALNAISETFVAYAGPLSVHCFDKDIYHSNLDDNDWEADVERWSQSQPVLRSITRATRNKPWRVNSAMFGDSLKIDQRIDLSGIRCKNHDAFSKFT